MNKFLVIALVLWNLVTFVLMGIDKNNARHGKYRISERTLFISAYLFGGIGIWCGMYFFRHKTKHLSFIILIPIAALINIILEYYIMHLI